VDQARSRFLPANVDARDVDFSDRVNGKRKSYKTSNRRQRILDDGTEELGDLSDDDGDDAENLERKIARLKREIEEVKDEYKRQEAASKEGKDSTKQASELQSLSQTLDEISRIPDVAIRVKSTFAAPPGAPSDAQGTTTRREIAHSGGASEQTNPLARAADFDRRLLVLEKSIGIGSSALPELDSTGLPRAIMPTLEALQKQISTLSEASTSSLDSISRRVRTLIQEADELEKSRRSAKAAQEALAQAGAAPPEGAGSDDSEQTAKINALYGTLPTIENLAPLLPPLLDRLRSLRAIHSDAATASETLDEIEKQQVDTASEIKQWREGLDKIEAVMKGSESTMTANMKTIEGWVKELEAKAAKIS